MELTITLPDVLAARLQNEAQTQKRSAEELAVELLDQALPTIQSASPQATNGNDFSLDMTLEELVAKIRETPPNPAAVRLPTVSLEEALAASLAREKEDNEEFDLEAWTREWNAFEQELKAVTRANNIAEGRG